MIGKIKLEIENCEKCPLYKTRDRVVVGDWNTKARIMFIGIAPGRLGADKTGIPFTKDKSGRFFRELLSKNNISQNLITVTNLVRCNPKDRKGNNRNPNTKEIEKCSKFLDKEIKITKPKIIVPLGKLVTEYLLKIKIKNFKDFHGKIIRKENVIFPMYHPSYIVNYNGYDKKLYENSFKKLIDLI